MKNILIIVQDIVVAKTIDAIVTNHNFEVVAISCKIDEIISIVAHKDINILLCDTFLAYENAGIELMHSIRRKHYLPIIFISAIENDKTLKLALELNPINIITKPFTEKQLVASLNIYFNTFLHKNIKQPTNRELLILSLIAKGLSSKKISETLSISFNTVETHRKNLMRKYKTKSMAELICLATSMNWVDYLR